MAPLWNWSRRPPTPPERQQDPNLLTLTEAARLLRCLPAVVWQRVQTLPVECVVRDPRGDLKFRRDALTRWMANRPLERETAERITREREAAARRASSSIAITPDRGNPLRQVRCPICGDFRPPEVIRYHVQGEHSKTPAEALEMLGKEE